MEPCSPQQWTETGDEEPEFVYFYGLRCDRRQNKRATLTGRGTVGKAIVAGAKDRATNTVRAEVVGGTDYDTLQSFVASHAAPGAKVYTDEHRAYCGMPFDHETVNHSVSEYVRDKAHTQGIESFWATLKRAYHGTYHHISPKHLQRYVQGFAGKHNIRDRDTIDQMDAMVAEMVGKRLMYRELIAD